MFYNYICERVSKNVTGMDTNFIYIFSQTIPVIIRQFNAWDHSILSCELVDEAWFPSLAIPNNHCVLEFIANVVIVFIHYLRNTVEPGLSEVMEAI